MEKINFTETGHADLSQLRTAETHADLVAAAEAEKPLPNVVLSANPDFPGRRKSYDDWPIDIHDDAGEPVGNVNLVQKSDTAYISGVDIERRGERFGMATYITIGGLARAVGREFRSDPQGLSVDSNHVWESLVAKGIAEPIPDRVDQHGFPHYTMGKPEAPPEA